MRWASLLLMLASAADSRTEFDVRLTNLGCAPGKCADHFTLRLTALAPDGSAVHLSCTDGYSMCTRAVDQFADPDYTPSAARGTFTHARLPAPAPAHVDPSYASTTPRRAQGIGEPRRLAEASSPQSHLAAAAHPSPRSSDWLSRQMRTEWHAGRLPLAADVVGGSFKKRITSSSRASQTRFRSLSKSTATSRGGPGMGIPSGASIGTVRPWRASSGPSGGLKDYLTYASPKHSADQ